MEINLKVLVTGSGRNWGEKGRALQRILMCDQGQKYWFNSWYSKLLSWAEYERGIRQR